EHTRPFGARGGSVLDSRAVLGGEFADGIGQRGARAGGAAGHPGQRFDLARAGARGGLLGGAFPRGGGVGAEGEQVGGPQQGRAQFSGGVRRHRGGRIGHGQAGAQARGEQIEDRGDRQWVVRRAAGGGASSRRRGPPCHHHGPEAGTGAGAGGPEGQGGGEQQGGDRADPGHGSHQRFPGDRVGPQQSGAGQGGTEGQQ